MVDATLKGLQGPMGRKVGWSVHQATRKYKATCYDPVGSMLTPQLIFLCSLSLELTRPLLKWFNTAVETEGVIDDELKPIQK